MKKIMSKKRITALMLTLVLALSLVCYSASAQPSANTAEEPTEVEYDEGVPMPNTVRPVIILQGSDYDIGYQYMTQLVQINGKELCSYQYDVEAVYRRDSIHKEFNDEEKAALARFETAIATYAPEWIDTLHGMADGAKDSGLDINYEDLLLHYSLFERMSSWGPHSLSDEVFQTGTNEEGNQVLGAKDAATCSGFVAWGESTVDGKLIATGITDDSEGNFSTTVMVFPETGNNYVTQTVNVVGFGGFPNHPNMNNKGLVRVHHAGSTYTANEATSYDALPRGIGDMHTIRFADNTEEAFELFMSYSPGTENLGNGIFYADVGVVHNDGEGDTHHALVAESRNPVSVRYPGDNGEGDFIYASNNWFCDNEARGGVKTEHGGYWDNDSWYWWSVSRNTILYNMFSQNVGKVDVEFMKKICRYPSKINESKTLEEIDAAYWSGNGSDYNASVGSLENSGIAIAVPDDGDNGLFYVSTGSVGRQDAPAYPDAHQYQPGKTGTFYLLKLAESPEAVAAAAREEAQRCMDAANEALSGANLADGIAQPLKDILSKAAEQFAKGEECLAAAAGHNESVYDISKATRCFAAAQAYGNQVYEVIVPPTALTVD